MMNEDFKKWLCEKAEYNYYLEYEQQPIIDRTLEILIKAMWAINREDKRVYNITMTVGGTYLSKIGSKFPDFVFFRQADRNNSETEALTAALEYIFEQDGFNG
jgi:hypothetical protein